MLLDAAGGGGASPDDDPTDDDGEGSRRSSRARQRLAEQPWRPSAWERVREGRWRLAPGAAVGALLVVAGVVVLLVLSATGGSGSVPTPTPAVAVPARGTPTATATATASSRPTSGPMSGPTGTAGPGPGTPAASAAATEVVVDVTGQVAQPGLVRLAPGARVDDALRAAGGALTSADLERVNRARVLSDGEQLVVPSPGQDVPASPQGQERAGSQPASGVSSGSSAGAAATGPVDLNTATATDLDALPGVGPVLAQRIIDWRSQHGRFSSVAELAEVAGIGPTTLTRLTPLLVV